MSETSRSPTEPAEVWITGIGLATSLGEGLDANWDALNANRINVDTGAYVTNKLTCVALGKRALRFLSTSR